MQRPVGHRAVVRAGPELDADREHVVAEHLAELVVVDLADVGGAAAEAGDTAHRVGGRAAAHLHRRAERLVQLDRAIGVDQVHPALDEAVLDQERVGRVGDHVDECVADPDHVVPGVALEHLLPTDGHGRGRYRLGLRGEHRSVPLCRTAGGPRTVGIGTLGTRDAHRTPRCPTALDPYRLPRHTVPIALRPRARARSRGGDVPRPGRDRGHHRRSRPMRSCSTRSSSRSSASPSTASRRRGSSRRPPSACS